MKVVKKKCVICNKIFKCKSNVQKYCSNKCADISDEKQRKFRPSLMLDVCECGNEKWQNSKTCQKCYWKSQKKYKLIEKICPVCKKPFITKNNSQGRICCSKKCGCKLGFKNSEYKIKKCKLCKTEFNPHYPKDKYCEKCVSIEFAYRNEKMQEINNIKWGNNGLCLNCGEKCKIFSYSKVPTKYCSRKCLDEYSSTRKLKKMWEEKIKIMVHLGGKCVKCGISDIRFLDINHIDRRKKEIRKDKRYTLAYRLNDWKKNIKNLELLCSNCHRIFTWEQMKYGESLGENFIIIMNNRLRDLT